LLAGILGLPADPALFPARGEGVPFAETHASSRGSPERANP
jgi:hypothetical protein